MAALTPSLDRILGTPTRPSRLRSSRVRWHRLRAVWRHGVDVLMPGLRIMRDAAAYGGLLAVLYAWTLLGHAYGL